VTQDEEWGEEDATTGAGEAGEEAEHGTDAES
jgi:hypothetical protein